jgi:hypothetical protein
VSANYENFSGLQGSQHIASRSSQLNLAEALEQLKPKMLLDWGSGIGTLVPIYIRLTEAKIVAFERNVWCRDRFLENIGITSRIELTESLPLGVTFDFITIDDEISLKEIFQLLTRPNDQVTIFIEGWRNSTLAKFSFALLLLRRSGEAERFRSRLHEFESSNKLEKSGSIIKSYKSNLLSSIQSWFKRTPVTKELNELFNYLLRKTRIYSLLANLNLGMKIRNALRLKPKLRKKAWLSAMENKRPVD